MGKKRHYVYKYVSAGNRNRYLHAHDKDKKVVRLFFCFTLFIILVVLICFSIKKMMNLIYNSDKIIVKSIEVVRTKNITKAEIKELLPFKVGDNFFKVNLSEAECEIKKLKPELKNVTIRRGWQRIKVEAYERIPEAFVVSSGKLFGIDFDGICFPLRGFMNAVKVPKLFYKSDYERKKLLNFIKRFKSVCGGNYLNNVNEMRFNNTKDLIFIMSDNTRVLWGKERSECLAYKFKKFQKVYLDALLRYKRLEYIDMTLYDIGRVFVKPIVLD
jgi:cell division protein FtsQ